MNNQATEVREEESGLAVLESPSFREIRDQALTWLAEREYTTVQLKERLFRIGCVESEVKGLLEYLAGRGYLNDQRVAEQLILTRIRGGYGPSRIQLELQSIGIPGSDAEELMSEIVVDWQLVIHNLLEKRTTPGELRKSRREKDQQVRYLVHRGFSIDQILEAFRLWD